MADKKQRLVLSILDFLSKSVSDGTVKSDDAEGLEVAIQCIGEAFGVNPEDAAQRERLSIAPANLMSIFDVYLKTREKMGSAASSSAAPSISSAGNIDKPKTVTPADKAQAEKLKAQGNSHMTAKDYTAAIASYTSAVQLDPTNPVYYSNRAAAHSSVEDHYSAIEDAEKALELDPKFAKAYSRMGHAYFCLEQYDEAKKSFEKGLALDPTNSNLKTGAESARAKLASTASTTSTPATARSPAPSTGGAAGGAGGMPDLSALLAGMGGGGGGMPDLASIMNNPMMMQAAQQMMANGGLEAMMQDPSIRSMAERLQSGGGMPSMAELMSDPTVRDMANRFGGGGAGPGAGNV